MSGTIESQLRYHAKHPDTPPPLRGLMLRAVEELRYRAMVIEQRNAEIKRGHDDFVQAITDPENQPSQWGTVTLALAQQVEQQPVCHGCGIPAGDVHMSTCQSGKWPSRVSNGDTAAPAPVAQQGEQQQVVKEVVVHADYRAMWQEVTRQNQQLCAALSAAPASQAQKPAAYITDTHQGPMVWTPEMYDEACTYCDDGEFPVPLYTVAPRPTSGDYALGYAEGFNDACKPAPQPVHQGERAELIRRLLAIANTEANEVADALNEAADMLQSAQPAQGVGRTNPGDETGGAVERFGWQTFLGKSPEIIPATNGSFVWYSDYLKLWQSAQPVAQYDKTEMNAFVTDLYQRKSTDGQHGFYETMFHVVHKAIARVGIREVK